MSYAITLDVPREGFADGLRERLSHEHAERRAAEQEGVREATLANLVGRGKLHPRFIRERDEALASAKKAAGNLRHCELLAEVHKQVAADTDNELVRAAATSEFVRADAERQLAASAHRVAEELARLKVAAAKAAVPDEMIAHVPALYDAQIEAGIAMAVAGLPGVGSRCKTVKVQIGGHVEAEPAGDGFVSAHVWPAD